MARKPPYGFEHSQYGSLPFLNRALYGPLNTKFPHYKDTHMVLVHQIFGIPSIISCFMQPCSHCAATLVA